MTREEAIQKAERALNDPIAKGGGVALLELDHLRVLLEALRDPQPDPDTGLVPCGCGGKAETHELFGEYSGTYMTDCKECGTGTTQYSTKKESQDAWNTAMGLMEVEG